jgi:hypothetical protein
MRPFLFQALTFTSFDATGMPRRPAGATAATSAEQGRGAGYYKVRSEIPGISATGGPAYLFTTVYARNGNHGITLHNILMSRSPVVTLLVKIEMAELPVFPAFDEEQTYWAWAFIATAVIPNPTPIAYERDT